MGSIAMLTRKLAQVIVIASVTRAVAAPALDVPAADTATIEKVFMAVTPSVVSIRARSRDLIPGTQIRFTERGSGVLISGDGKVLTAAHLVYAMDDISVVFSTGETISAKVASESSAPDLAVLQLQHVPQSSTVSRMADSSTVAAGDDAFIVGANYRERHSLNVGSVKVQGSLVTATVPLVDFFRGDAVLDITSSGAPMFNLYGEVIGIVSQKISSGYASAQPEFVITLNTTRLLQLEKRSSREQSPTNLVGRPLLVAFGHHRDRPQ